MYMNDFANFFPVQTGLNRILNMGEPFYDYTDIIFTYGKVRSNSIKISFEKEPKLLSGKISKKEFNNIKNWIQLNYDLLIQIKKLYHENDCSFELQFQTKPIGVLS